MTLYQENGQLNIWMGIRRKKWISLFENIYKFCEIEGRRGPDDKLPSPYNVLYYHININVCMILTSPFSKEGQPLVSFVRMTAMGLPWQMACVSLVYASSYPNSSISCLFRKHSQKQFNWPKIPENRGNAIKNTSLYNLFTGSETYYLKL